MPIAPATSQSFAAELDRRSGARRPLRTAAAISLPSGPPWPAQMVDVGLRGLSLHLDHDGVPVGAGCDVTFTLPLKEAEHPIRVRAKVTRRLVRSGGYKLDLEVQHTSPEDALALERFVIER